MDEHTYPSDHFDRDASRPVVTEACSRSRKRCRPALATKHDVNAKLRRGDV